MSFFTEYLSYFWGQQLKGYDAQDLKAWTEFLDVAEKDRQRECVQRRTGSAHYWTLLWSAAASD